MMIDVDFPPASLMPEKAVPTTVFVLVSWLEPETGEELWTSWHESDLPLHSLVGLLEMAKLDLFTGWFTPEADDDE